MLLEFSDQPLAQYSVAYEPDRRHLGNVVPRQLFETQYRALVDLLCQRWGLERGHGPIRHGYNAVVVPVRRSSEPLVLKLNWPALGVSEEVRGLEAWDGNGMVWMLAADGSVGALLLERPFTPARGLLRNRRLQLRPLDSSAALCTTSSSRVTFDHQPIMGRGLARAGCRTTPDHCHR